MVIKRKELTKVEGLPLPLKLIMSRRTKMKREELQSMKRDDLAEICKAHGLPHCRGKNRLKKDELIEAILKAECTGESTKETKSAVDEEKIDDAVAVEVENKDEKESTNGIDEQKMSYIERAEIGTIIACTIDGKVRSAKIVKRSSKKRRFMVETAYGAQHIVPYESVIWVRTGNKWPRGVYRALKGLETEVARGSENEKAD